MKLENAAKQLNALGNPTRLQVCRMLVHAGDAGLSVRQLRERLDIAASTLSDHLDRLIGTGLVAQERRAMPLICRANFRAIDSLLGYLIDECCVDDGPSTMNAQLARAEAREAAALGPRRAKVQ